MESYNVIESISNEQNKQIKSNDEKIKDKLKEIEDDIKNMDYHVLDIKSQKPKEKHERKGSSVLNHINRPRISESEKEEIGLLGEKCVYETLKMIFIKKKVQWISLNAKKAEINSNGNDGFGYDIYYKNDKGIGKYVEVKSSKNEEYSFNISKSEVAFGEKNKENYEIWLVMNVFDKNNRKFRTLKNIFKYEQENETFNNNSKFIVENENFRIRFNVDN